MTSSDASMPVNKMTFDLRVDDRMIVVEMLKEDFFAGGDRLSMKSAIEASGENVPGVYFIYNKKEIYIGQSVEPYTRIMTHKARKRLLPPFKAFIFASPQFTQSSIYDIETSLIRLASADINRPTRTIVNAQFSQSSKNYFLKDQYANVSDTIWSSLIDHGIASTEPPEIKKLAEYRLSPFTSLNDGQRAIVAKILGGDFPLPDPLEVADDVYPGDYITAPIMKDAPWRDQITIVEGFPGTGKSVLAAALYSQIAKTGKACLVAGTKHTRVELGRVFKNYKKQVKNGYPLLVTSPSNLLNRMRAGERFEGVIIDEGHRLVKNAFTGFYKANENVLKHKKGELEQIAELTGGRGVIVMYDANQTVHPNDYRTLEFPGYKTVRYRLTRQERMKLGSEYAEMLFELLATGRIFGQGRQTGYDFRIFSSFSKMLEALKQRKQTGAHCFISSGYTREWDSERTGTPEFQIDGQCLRWNDKNADDWVQSSPARNLEEVGYYNYVQGLDADYCGVIIGKDLGYSTLTSSFKAVDSHVVGVKPTKKRSSPEEYEQNLTDMVINRYKVLLTRGREGTYVFIEDESTLNAFKGEWPTAVVD